MVNNYDEIIPTIQAKNHGDKFILALSKNKQKNLQGKNENGLNKSKGVERKDGGGLELNTLYAYMNIKYLIKNEKRW